MAFFGVKKVNGAAYPGIWVEKQVTFIKVLFSGDISAIPAANLTELGTTTAASTGTVADGTFGVVESVLVQALEVLELDATILGVSQYSQTGPTVVVTMAAGAGSGTTITVTSTTGLIAGQTVAVTGGTGSFVPGTKVTDVLSATQFTVSLPPTVALTGATVTGSTFSGGQVDVMLGYASAWIAPTANGVITATSTTGYTFTNAQAVIVAAGSAAADSLGTLVSVVPSAYTWGLEFVFMDGNMDVSTLANGGLVYFADGLGSGTAALPMGSPGYYPVDPYTA